MSPSSDLVPQDSGSKGTQEPGTVDDDESLEGQVITPYGNHPLLKRSAGLVAATSNKSWSLAHIGWLSSTIEHYVQALESSTEETRRLRQELSDVRDNLHTSQRLSDRLRIRLTLLSRSRLSSMILNTLGAGLVGAAITEYLSSGKAFTVGLLSVLGITLLVVSWILMPKGDAE